MSNLCALYLSRITLTSLSFSQGSLVAVGTHKGFVQIWDAAGGRKLTSLEGHSARVGLCHVTITHSLKTFTGLKG